jgi:hypothetical protein
MTPMTVAVSDELDITPTLSINDVTLHQPAFDGKFFLRKKVRLRCTGNEDVLVGWRIEAKIKDSDKLNIKEVFASETEYVISGNCIDLKITLIKDPSNITPPDPDPIETATIDSNDIQLSLEANELLVSGLKGSSVVSVFDISSRLIAKVKTTGETAAVRLPGKGVYIVHVSNNNRSLSRKIVY